MLNVMDVQSTLGQLLFGNPCTTPRQAPARIPDHLINPALHSDRCPRNPTSRNEDSYSNEGTDILSAISASHDERDSLASDDDDGGVNSWGATN
jgi:hypothetical protein